MSLKCWFDKVVVMGNHNALWIFQRAIRQREVSCNNKQTLELRLYISRMTWKPLNIRGHGLKQSPSFKWYMTGFAFVADTKKTCLTMRLD